MNLELKKKTKKTNWRAEGEENGLKKNVQAQKGAIVWEHLVF